MIHLRIATYNIHRCVGRDGKEDIDRTAAVLNELNADVVALQEVTSSSIKSNDMLANLALAVGMEPIEGFTLTTSGTQYGNALLTRLPVSAIYRTDISVAGKEPRGVIEAVYTPPGRGLTTSLWATHLGLGIAERRLQVKKLLQIVGSSESDVSILAGDFNEWMIWGRSLRAMQSFFTKRPSPPTFPAWRPLLKLDRIWVKPIDKLSALGLHKSSLSKTASDHLPLVADIII